MLTEERRRSRAARCSREAVGGRGVGVLPRLRVFEVREELAGLGLCGRADLGDVQDGPHRGSLLLGPVIDLTPGPGGVQNIQTAGKCNGNHSYHSTEYQ